MKRKNYQKPAMQIVKLQQQCCILAGSDQQPKACMNVQYETEDWPE